jgi:type IV secretion system protein VirB4
MAVAETKMGPKLANEANGETHIPYTCHVDPYTLKTKDGKLCQIIKLEGVAHETSDTSQLNNWKNSRNFLWRSIASNKLSIWTHTVRYKKNDYPHGEFQSGFSKDLNAKYKKSLENTEMYVNDLYISVISQSSSDKIASLAETFKGMFSKIDKSNYREAQQKRLDELDEATRKILKSLSPYSPSLLSVYSADTKGRKVNIVKDIDDCKETDTDLYILKSEEAEKKNAGEFYSFSEPLEFIGFLVNGFWRKIPLGFKHAGKSVLATKISFEKKHFLTESTAKKRCGGIISIKEYINASAPGMVDGLLTLPVEFILTQSFTFLNKRTAIKLVETHQSRMISSGDLSATQVDELSLALDQLTSNEFCMGDHHFTLSVMSDSLKKMNNDLALCEAELSDFGLLTSKEYLGLEACFWAQLPGNNSYIVRKAPITSLNFAAFVSLHNYPQGKFRGNHWGDAVALLKTSSNTPYYFNFHYPKDLGNTTVIGPSGGGKTVLMLFLQSMIEKHKPTQIVFDKDRGAEIFIRAQNGNYSPIKAGEKTGFNPLQLPDTEKNRKFLRDWVTQLVSVRDKDLTAEEVEEIAEAVDGNFKLNFEERLSNIYDFFQFGEDNSIKQRLKAWLEEGDKGWVFDNEEDSLTLDTRLMGFDVTDFLNDPVIRTPLLMYLFHRIDALLDGRRITITLDEGWKLLDDPYFGIMFKDWLKVIRKKNGLTVFGTQEPADVISSAVGKTIMTQSPTQIFLPNPKADRVDYIEGFKLTEREYSLLVSTPQESRQFLIKQGTKSVMAELSLTGMDDEISVLSSTTENISILDKIRREVGNDSADWLPNFYKTRT